MTTLIYDGLALVVETVECDVLEGDRCVGTTERVVGIERVVEGPLDPDQQVAARISDWLLDLDGVWLRGFCHATMRVHDGPALAKWLTKWGGDNLLESLTELVNAERRAAGLPEFASGVGLHLGRVLYGNIGTAGRLEFSVIGAAANEAARIEALCKETGRDIVLSQAVAARLGEPCPSLGKFALRGVAEPLEVFALP